MEERRVRVQRTRITVGGGGERGGEWKLLVPAWSCFPGRRSLLLLLDVHLQVPRKPLSPPSTRHDPPPSTTSQSNHDRRQKHNPSKADAAQGHDAESSMAGIDNGKSLRSVGWNLSHINISRFAMGQVKVRGRLDICTFTFSDLPLQRIMRNLATDRVIRSRDPKSPSSLMTPSHRLAKSSRRSRPPFPC